MGTGFQFCKMGELLGWVVGGYVCNTANVLHATELHAEKWLNDKFCYVYFTPEIMAVASWWDSGWKGCGHWTAMLMPFCSAAKHLVRLCDWTEALSVRVGKVVTGICVAGGVAERLSPLFLPKAL